MTKEKTRAELHAIIAGLKDDLQVADGKLQNATIVHRELKEKLEKEASELRSEVALLKCNRSIDRELIEKKRAEIERLKAREEYLEGELKEKTELNTSQGERIQEYSESIERIRADRDKAQYIAADLLEHGVFHFLIVKYRNLHSK